MMKSAAWSQYLARGVFEPAFDGRAKEKPAQFNKNMYPKGVNADFFATECNKAPDVLCKFQEKFEGDARDISLARGNVVKMLRGQGLEPGSRVLDVGAGTGLFVRPLSEVVGTDGAGLVYATEVSDIFKMHLDDLVRKEKLANVVVEQVSSDLASFSTVPDGSIDLAIVVDVYHHFEYPKTAMRAIRRALKPHNGRVVVVDFIRDPAVHTSHAFPWILDHVRAGQAKFRREIQSVGLRLLEEPVIPGLEENYTMVFGVGTPTDVPL